MLLAQFDSVDIRTAIGLGLGFTFFFYLLGALAGLRHSAGWIYDVSALKIEARYRIIDFRSRESAIFLIENWKNGHQFWCKLPILHDATLKMDEFAITSAFPESGFKVVWLEPKKAPRELTRAQLSEEWQREEYLRTHRPNESLG